MLWGPDDTWVVDKVKMQMMVRYFFVNLYTSEQYSAYDTSKWRFPTLSHSNLKWLNHDILEHEIDEAVFHMGSHKTPGPDGMLTLFY